MDEIEDSEMTRQQNDGGGVIGNDGGPCRRNNNNNNNNHGYFLMTQFQVQQLTIALENSMVSRNTNFNSSPSITATSTPTTTNDNYNNNNNNNNNVEQQQQQLRLDLMYRWMKCSCNNSHARIDISMKWFDKLYECHCSSTRYYHTIMHLEEIFLYFDLHKQQQQQQQQHFYERQTSAPIKSISSIDEEIIVLSTFFHDAVYNVHSSTNEEDSAQLFQQYIHELRMNGIIVPNDIESNVVEIIIATKTHQISSSSQQEEAQEEQVQEQQANNDDIATTSTTTKIPIKSLFLDLDMAVLGKEWDAYKVYASLIRREYNHVPHNTYCTKRAEILQNFLLQPSSTTACTIYHTVPLRNAFELRARDNITKEIRLLQQQIIPTLG